MKTKYETCPYCNQRSLQTTDDDVIFCCNPECDGPEPCPYCNQETLVISEDGDVEFCNNPFCRGGVDE
jgi:hypothetical protein